MDKPIIIFQVSDIHVEDKNHTTHDTHTLIDPITQNPFVKTSPKPYVSSHSANFNTKSRQELPKCTAYLFGTQSLLPVPHSSSHVTMLRSELDQTLPNDMSEVLHTKIITDYLTFQSDKGSYDFKNHPLLKEEIVTIVEVPFRPTCLVQVPDTWHINITIQNLFKKTLEARFKLRAGTIQLRAEKRSYVHGWVPNPDDGGQTAMQWPLWRLSFPSLSLMRDATHFIERQVKDHKVFILSSSQSLSWSEWKQNKYDNNTKTVVHEYKAELKIYENNHDPSLLFQNEMGIRPSGHVLLLPDHYHVIETSQNNIQFPTNTTVNKTWFQASVKSGWDRGIYTSKRPFQILQWRPTDYGNGDNAITVAFNCNLVTKQDQVVTHDVLQECLTSQQQTDTLVHWLSRRKVYNAIFPKTTLVIQNALKSYFAQPIATQRGITTIKDGINSVSKMKVASFDLECYSASGRFPKAKHADDVIIMVGTSVCKIGTFADEEFESDKPKPKAVSQQQQQQQKSALGQPTKPESVGKDTTKPKTYQEAFAKRAKEKKKDPVVYKKEAYERHIFCLTRHPNAAKIQRDKQKQESREQKQMAIALHDQIEKLKQRGGGNDNAIESATATLASSKPLDHSIKKIFEMSDEEKLRLEQEDAFEKKKPLVLHYFDDELEMLLAWKKWINEIDPDVFTGHNIHKFDFLYLHQRFAKQERFQNDAQRFFSFSRFYNLHTPLEEKEFNSGAAGNNSFFKSTTPGRSQIDTYTYTKRNIPGLSSWALGAICRQFLGLDKLDVSPFQIFEYFLSSDPELIGRIARYCAVDCDLVLDLLIDLKTIPTIVEMSRVTFTKFQNILDKGQQEKIYNFLSEIALARMYVINYKRPKDDSDANRAAETSNLPQESDADCEINKARHPMFIASSINSSNSSNSRNRHPVASSMDDIEASNEIDDDADQEQGQKSVSRSNAYRRNALGDRDNDDDDDTSSDDRNEEEMDSDEEREMEKKKQRKADSANNRKEKGYAGATVFPPFVGLYSRPVGVLDFTSMYPYAMKSRNLCASTWVPNPTPDQLDKEKNKERQRQGLPWYHVVDIRENTLGLEEKIDRKHGYAFKGKPSNYKKLTFLTRSFDKDKDVVKTSVPLDAMQSTLPLDAVKTSINPDATKSEINCESVIAQSTQTVLKQYCFVGHVLGITSIMLSTCIDKRNAVKGLLKILLKEHDKSHPDYQLLDIRQNSYKITGNSIYGFNGSGKRGRLPCPAVAECTTAESRTLIETSKAIVESPKFHCKVLYGDTDSIMIQSDNPLITRAEMGKLCEEIADYITNIFERKATLCYEKIYHPWLLLKKKKYGGMKYDPDGDFKIHTRGLEDVRRDNPERLRRCIADVLFLICATGDYGLALHYIQEEILRKFKNREFTVDDYVTSKTLARGYAKPENMIQWQVAERKRERMPGSEPPVGDRVPYVIILTKNCATVRFKFKRGQEGKRPSSVVNKRKIPIDKIAKQADDAEFVKRSNTPLDHVYYLNCFRRSCDRLFSFAGRLRALMHAKFDDVQESLVQWSCAQMGNQVLNSNFVKSSMSLVSGNVLGGKRKLETLDL